MTTFSAFTQVCGRFIMNYYHTSEPTSKDVTNRTTFARIIIDQLVLKTAFHKLIIVHVYDSHLVPSLIGRHAACKA